MTTKGDSSRPFQIVPPGGGDGTIPGHWPECPGYLSEGQRARFWGICRRLEGQGTLESADVGKIEALAIAEDNLEVSTAAVNAGGKYATTVKQGRPYQCPACKGTCMRPVPKGSAAAAPVQAASRGKIGHRQCSICCSSRRADIDTALGRGDSLRAVAKAFATTKDAAMRHKREHLGRPLRPVGVTPGDPTCLGCGGKGVIIPETREVTEKRPETTDQRYAIDQVAKLSAQLGLDVTSRVRVKGKPSERRGPSALEQLAGRRGLRK